MSLMPVFSPYVSAYNFANIAHEDTYSVTLRSKYNIAFNPDGSTFYLAHEDSDSFTPYACATDWDISSVTPGSAVSLTTTVSAGSRGGLFFNGDGSKVFIGLQGGIATDYIEEHALSSAYGGTATYTTRLAGPGGDLGGFAFVNGGAKIIAFNTSNVFYDCTLSTAYDLSTAGSWSLALLDLSSTYGATLGGILFGKTDGQMIVVEDSVGSGDTEFHEYRLSTPGDISTASLVTSKNYTTLSSQTRMYDGVFGDNGRKFFAVGQNTVEQFATVN